VQCQPLGGFQYPTRLEADTLDGSSGEDPHKIDDNLLAEQVARLGFGSGPEEGGMFHISDMVVGEDYDEGNSDEEQGSDEEDEGDVVSFGYDEDAMRFANSMVEPPINEQDLQVHDLDGTEEDEHGLGPVRHESPVPGQVAGGERGGEDAAPPVHSSQVPAATAVDGAPFTHPPAPPPPPQSSQAQDEFANGFFHASFPKAQEFPPPQDPSSFDAADFGEADAELTNWGEQPQAFADFPEFPTAADFLPPPAPEVVPTGTGGSSPSEPQA